MARVAKGKHSTTVVVADDGSSPVGTDEWNAAPLDTGMEGNTESTITITSGEITVTDTVTIVAAESGTADDLDFVTYANTNANDRIWLYADAGDTITLRHNQSPGAGEGAFITASAGSITLSETVGVLFIRRGTTFYQVTEVTVGAGDALVANPLSQFAATTSAQLAGVLSDETGSGAAVFATSPTLVTPALGTPSALVLTNATGTLTSPTLVTPVLGTPSSGTLTSCTGLPITGITSSTSAEIATLCSDETGSGLLVFGTSPTLITPVLGTPSSGTLTNCTGLPLAGLTTAAKTEAIGIACGDETTVTAVATGVTEFQMPYAFTLTEVRATLTTAPTTDAGFTVDINEGGTTILSTKITIDATEKTSTSAATPAVISDSSLADGAVITIDVDAASTGATEAGLKIWLIGYQT